MNEDLDYQLDKNGNIDADYYIKKAHQLRGLYLAEILTGVKVKFKALLHVKLPIISIDRTAHH